MIPVTKMSGAGNDFVVLDGEAREAVTGDWGDWVRRVCRRGLSVGADGVLVVTRRGRDRVGVEFFNPDGGPAFCGNGSRCAARFASLRGLAGDRLTLETAAGDVPARVAGGRVELSLPPPRDLGMLTLDLDGETVTGRRIDSGSPHVVTRVDDVGTYPLERIGPAVRRHPRLGERGSNFNVVSEAADGVARVRTWERGVEAETLACGSGAVATAFALYLDGGAAAVRLIAASGAALDVGFDGPADDPRAASLAGDARVVFEASLEDEAVRF